MTFPRLVGAGACLVVGLVLVWYGWTIVDNIWGAGDSPDWAYLLYGLPLIALGLGSLAAGALLTRTGRRRADIQRRQP